MTNWRNKGLIFTPTGAYDWMQSYAQVPTPIMINDVMRIYYTTRCAADVEGKFKSFTSFVEGAADNPARVVYVHDRPVIELGGPGTFDEFGIMPGSIIRHENANELYLYYTGWSRLSSVPYSTQIGLAISQDNGISFKKISEGPVIGSSIHDPYLVNGPYVMKIGDLYHMWYASGVQWIEHLNRYETVYLIKHSTSSDGISWSCDSNLTIPTELEDEAQNRPYVIKLADTYYMFFSYRRALHFRDSPDCSYKLAYATSKDALTWVRQKGELKIDKRLDWDAQMQAYPAPIICNNKMYLFYNGDSFGKNGFGYAEAER